MKFHLGDVKVSNVCERDKVIMELILTVTPPLEWERLNRVRHFQTRLFHVSTSGWGWFNSSAKDGRSSLGLVFMILFLVQWSTVSDSLLWKSKIKVLPSLKLCLSPSLGKHLRKPYDSEVWWQGEEEGIIHGYDQNSQKMGMFRVSGDQWCTRGGMNYELVEYEMIHLPVRKFYLPPHPQEKGDGSLHLFYKESDSRVLLGEGLFGLILKSISLLSTAYLSQW